MAAVVFPASTTRYLQRPYLLEHPFTRCTQNMQIDTLLDEPRPQTALDERRRSNKRRTAVVLHNVYIMSENTNSFFLLLLPDSLPNQPMLRLKKRQKEITQRDVMSEQRNHDGRRVRRAAFVGTRWTLVHPSAILPAAKQTSDRTGIVRSEIFFCQHDDPSPFFFFSASPRAGRMKRGVGPCDVRREGMGMEGMMSFMGES